MEVLWAFLFLLSHTPRFFRYYMLKYLIASILILVGYRKKVITRNLANSFPEKSADEIKRLCLCNYLFLGEVIVDTISLVGASEKRKRNAGRQSGWLSIPTEGTGRSFDEFKRTDGFTGR